MEGVMDCTCMPNMTAMHEDMQMMESMMSASGRAIRYVKKVENGQLRVRPMPVVKDRSQIQAAITGTISSLLSSALGRSIPVNKVAKVALRQFDFPILQQLGNNAAEQPTNIMEDMVMNMIQQQIEQMISSGELENMLMEFMSSGALEQMMMEFMADPATEQMINEMMQMPSEEQMAEMEQGWMEMMSSMGVDLQMMMQMMEMKSHCKCTSSDVAYGEMAMPT